MRQTVLECNPEAAPPPEETPVDIVLRLFGSAKAGAIAGLTTEAVRKWNRRLSRGGQGGCVPSRYAQLYLDEAKRMGLELTAAMLIAEPRP